MANAQVAGRPHVVAREGVHEVHLRGPGTDTAHRDHVGEYLVVTHASVMGEADTSVTTALGEVEHGGGLGVGEADTAKLRVTGGVDGIGTDRSLTEINHALVNRVGGLRGEQLVGDGASEVGETFIHWRAAPRGWWADLSYDVAKGAISRDDHCGTF